MNPFLLVFLIIVSLTLLGVIIFYAMSSKSSRLLKLAAIIALGLICLSLVICGIVLIIGPKEDTEVVPFTVSRDSPATESESSMRIGEIIFIAIIFIALGLVIAKAVKDQQKLNAAKAKIAPARPPAYHEANELDDLEHQEAPGKADDDDGFDLDI